MDEDTIRSAYAPFVAALRNGGFTVPEDGWPAELVAAHVSLNNDLISEAAERIVAGEQPSYDNIAAVDETALGSYADAAGGLAGLADAVEASARRLAKAWAALDETTGSCLLPAVIRDSGAVVIDRPIAIRDFIEGNASFHLDAHLAQLKALQPTAGEAGTQRTAEPPTEFDTYQFVLLRRPEQRPEIDDERADLLQSQHLGYLATMKEDGHMKVAGPLSDQPDDTWRGFSIYQVGSVEEARRLAELDPAVRAGHLTVDVMSWHTPKGALNFPD
jgi:uncharacterized protein YciI